MPCFSQNLDKETHCILLKTSSVCFCVREHQKGIRALLSLREWLNCRYYNTSAVKFPVQQSGDFVARAAPAWPTSLGQVWSCRRWLQYHATTPFLKRVVVNRIELCSSGAITSVKTYSEYVCVYPWESYNHLVYPTRSGNVEEAETYHQAGWAASSHPHPC